MSAQGAVLAAASGMLAAARLNHALTAELATSGGLPETYGEEKAKFILSVARRPTPDRRSREDTFLG